MRINTALDRIRKFLSSAYYPLVLMALSFACWLSDGGTSIFFAILYALLSLAPLFGDDGRPYLSIFLFLIPMSNQDISFFSFSPAFLLSIIFAYMSVIIFLIRIKRPLIFGELFYPLLFLFFVFFLSYMVYSANNGFNGVIPILYILTLSVLLTFYLVISTVIGRENTIISFAQSAIYLSILVSLEVYFTLLKDNTFFASAETFTLGWSYTRDTATSILLLTMPFYGIIIKQRKPLWLISEMFSILAVILLSNDAGLLCLIIGFIPMMLLTFNKKSYGRFHAYYSLIGISIVVTIFILLIGLNESFFQRVLSAIQSLNFVSTENERYEIYQKGLEQFQSNYVLGSSFSLMIDGDRLSFLYSTPLTILAAGGLLGLAIYLFMDIRLYIHCMMKKSEERSMLLMTLIAMDFIGLFSNAFFNLADFTFMLLAISAYFMSDKPEDCVIHADFYENRRQIRNLKIR